MEVSFTLLYTESLLDMDTRRKPWSVSKTAYVTGRYIGLVNLL